MMNKVFKSQKHYLKKNYFLTYYLELRSFMHTRISNQLETVKYK